MLNKIIHFSIKNKLVVGLLTVALIIWGVWSATKLPLDAVPDITNNQVQIITLRQHWRHRKQNSSLPIRSNKALPIFLTSKKCVLFQDSGCR